MRKSLAEIRSMKSRGEKIAMLTAYDASMARLLSGCDVDMLLVGDSLGMVMLGYDSTVPVTMDEMIHHAKAVRRGAPESFIVGDLPYGSYQTGVRDAINNGLRFLKEADCDAIKLEGGLNVCGIVEALVGAGIPVMAHIGLTPQTASQLGGYKVQGKGIEDARRLLAEAKALEAAGAFSIILECVPDTLAKVISASLTMPTVGIGAGVHCDGQVLVTHDLLGMFEKFTPKFVKKFADLSPLIKESIRTYGQEVKKGSYPGIEHSFTSQTDYNTLLD
ncbi:3-methyl-2-oxobutanoate hydroxymethyltransferase [Desulforhopalus sp. IMCC35007]|uniref:3-methyl-2-oxobutanoate hydroxymethyltransferase n=1 Tax=Desulforhopalus sp. IMCC35007 TaxID=2569543 RepID=UPI0010AE81DE|nr:3-methyl-2-oxobutanoate hydroxymethyltransferase [Desulforhopalus sp. IMCC35007]TKB06246.1 3-methyl-2-oxobutanoate hydroxymethyltransferase [Desulforhopalus sp. IMCC35007]